MSASTTVMTGEDPPVTSLMMLPDDMILNCLARVSRLYYPTLSLVSKRFRILIASPELERIRILLGCMESRLYVSSTHRTNPLRWFTLCQRPHSAEKFLVPIPSPNSPTDFTTAVAAVGHHIYAIGGLINNNESSSVLVLDCRSNTWSEAPSMHVARSMPSACVLDEKIYVIGGCKELDSTNWIEFFDTNTNTWEFLQIPSEEICLGSRYKSVGYKGTIHVRSEDLGETYQLYKGSRWRADDIAMNNGWGFSSSHCVIANVFYRAGSLCIDWYDSNNRIWKPLHGLEGLRGFKRNVNAKLADYNGNLVVLWEEYSGVHLDTIIWCADITLKRLNREIIGTVEWFDKVFESNGTCLHALVSCIY